MKKMVLTTKLTSLELDPAKKIFKVNGQDFGKHCERYDLHISQDFRNLKISLYQTNDDIIKIFEYREKPKNADVSVSIK